MAKNRHAVELGKKGGKIGGKSTSPAKRAAAVENAKKATLARMESSKRLQQDKGDPEEILR